MPGRERSAEQRFLDRPRIGWDPPTEPTDGRGLTRAVCWFFAAVATVAMLAAAAKDAPITALGCAAVALYWLHAAAGHIAICDEDLDIEFSEETKP